MSQTFMDGNNIYSVDMMISYIRLQSPHIFYVKMEDFVDQLKKNIWGNPSKGIRYSPMSVITNPSSNQHEYDKIMRANISFPIILSPRGDLIDGIHRVSKVYLKKINGDKQADNFQLRAVMFDDTLMAKFLLSSTLDWKKVHSMKTFDFIELYARRFSQRRPPYPLPKPITNQTKSDPIIDSITDQTTDQTRDQPTDQTTDQTDQTDQAGQIDQTDQAGQTEQVDQPSDQVIS